MKPLQQTYLIQRLNEPYNVENKLSALGSAFSFGGGLKNGGLSSDAMKLLSPIFSFDYMGSSEFEWGAVPKCLESIAKRIKDYSAHQTTINKTKIFVICIDEQKVEIDLLLKELAKNKIHLKEYSNIGEAVGLNPRYKKEDCRTIGWLELDNNFMFFTQKQAFEKTAELFGILIPEIV